MQKCSSRHCSCLSSSPLSMFLSSSLPNDDLFPPVQAVDCTLSLATPSSTPPPHDTRRSTASTHFCWDIFPPPPPLPVSSFLRDTTIVPHRQCVNCHTTSTPLWRNGPFGPKSLCNACGIRYKKEERRAYAAAARANGGSDGSGVALGSETAQRVVMIKNTSWPPALPPHYTQAQKKGCFLTSAAYGGGRNELMSFLDAGGGDHRRRDPDVISWRHLSNVVFFPGANNNNRSFITTSSSPCHDMI
ncbi:hypothetical protein DM860_004846 [Cuscuta australis]|uniref:GATA-type domain-containing protein n=1 Tax=Cuscuta australis TaxID=267555 RepID=A0A328DLL0_9ASTE|nr:hypothetical protein DM860_004846 [Cuscuta australis]